MTTIKNSRQPVTLTPAHPNITITGTIDAIGPAGTYAVFTGSPLESLQAAVFGPAGADFSIRNNGTILSKSTAATDFGIVLGAPGTVTNTGLIKAANGIFAAGRAAIKNAGNVTGTIDYGIDADGGTITNQSSGLIQGAKVGIAEAGQSEIVNAGSIAGYDGIYARSGGVLIQNAGNIDGTTHVGVIFTGTLTNALGGIIRGDYLGANLYGAGYIANAGLITGNDDGIFLENLLTQAGGSSVDRLRNTGTIHGQQAGIRIQQGSGDRADITNAASGLITAAANGRAAIADYVQNLISVTNAGTIEGATGIEFSGPATIRNTGLILATGGTGNAGITLGGGTLYNAGIITGATGISILYGGVVEDSGTVASTNGVAISFRKASNPFGPIAYANTLALAPGAVIDGTIDLFGTLELGGAEFGILNQATGSLNLTDIVQPTAILVGAGDIWRLSGAIAGYNGSKLFNQGTLLSTAGGTVITSASIFNQGYIGGGGVGIGDGARYIHNNGTITGTKTGAQLGNFSSLVNSATGTIGGISLAIGDVINNTGAITAVITGTGADSYIQNHAGGRITATTNAISLTGAINLYNAGYIKGGADAIAILGGYITNFGTIIGGKYAISVASDSNASLILSPSAVTKGAVDLGNGDLQLVAGAVAGTVSNIQFKNFYALTVASGAEWNLAGTFNAGALVNNGTIDELASDHLIIGEVSGAGTIEMPKHLTIAASAYAGQKIDFTGTGETIDLGLAQSVRATFRSFALGDTIDFADLTLSSNTGLTFANNTLTLKETSGDLTLTFTADHALAIDHFVLSAAGHGTAITLATTSSAGALAQNPFTTPTSIAPLLTLGS
jgi:hypothetical protein